MKSKLVRVKVWYEHQDRAEPEQVGRDLAMALAAAVSRGRISACGVVDVHKVEVEGATQPMTRQPEPDF